jgi:hypothetical protein
MITDLYTRAREIAAGLTPDEQLRIIGDEDGYPMHSCRAVALGLIVFDYAMPGGRRVGRWVYTPEGRAVARVLAGEAVPDGR